MRMGSLFDVAKANTDLPIAEVERLLDHPAYEPRMAAFCILDFKSRRKLEAEQRAELYDVYLRRHDRITTWDMVDRSAPRVVGGYLTGRDKRPLHELASADEPLRRRTAITAPLFYTRSGTPTWRSASPSRRPSPPTRTRSCTSPSASSSSTPAPATRRRCWPSSTSTHRRCPGRRCGWRSRSLRRTSARRTEPRNAPEAASAVVNSSHQYSANRFRIASSRSTISLAAYSLSASVRKTPFPSRSPRARAHLADRAPDVGPRPELVSAVDDGDAGLRQVSSDVEGCRTWLRAIALAVVANETDSTSYGDVRSSASSTWKPPRRVPARAQAL